MKFIIFVIPFLFSCLGQAETLNGLVVFGDSLSDTGNLYEYTQGQLPESPPYYRGRFADGPIWVEQLLQSYFPEQPKQHLLNYAIGGAGVSEDPEDEDLFTLKKEIDNYLAEQHPANNYLYVIWIGANNYLGVPDNPELALEKVNSGIKVSLTRLIAAGAEKILLITLPDLGKLPLAHEYENQTILTYLSQQHNQQLLKIISEFKQLYPQIKWLFFDVNEMLEKIYASPQLYGFSNVTDTCKAQLDQMNVSEQLKLAKIARLYDACEGFLFFDAVHPATQAHGVMAEQVKLLLSNADIELG